MVEIVAPPQSGDAVRSHPDVLRDVEVIFGGWGSPRYDERMLSHAPKLRAIFYGAGSVKSIVSDALWDRGIVVTSAYAANAVPVTEYTVAQILFSLKQGWFFALETKRRAARVPRTERPITGAFGSTVGLISLGMIGRRVAEMLRPFDVRVIAYDPFVTDDAVANLGVTMVPTVESIFEHADVVSLHTPWLKETEGMIRGEHFARMRPNAIFINTARGAVVRENEMIEALAKRPDLTAVLDVTYPEPCAPGSALLTLPNVVLTPHIAGSQGPECRRMGLYMIDELKRYLNGEPLKWAIDRTRAAVMA
jgi:phosphoglycerate dehydrogenase-like enzyme